MIPTNLPDLLSTSRMSRDMVSVNSQLNRAAEELTTGLKSDLVAATKGDPTRLYALERDISMLGVRKNNLAAAQGRSEVTQSALTGVKEALATIDVDLAATSERGDFASAQRIASGGRAAFETVIQALNARYGERSLFSGADAAGPSLASADDILTEIETRVAGAADPAAVQAIIDDYFFTDPAGFETTGYLGSTSDASAIELADGERLDYAVRADDPAVRAALASLAAVVVGAEELAPALGQGQRLELFTDASLDVINAQGLVIDVQARLGVAEERIEIASVRVEAERSTLERALNDIVARDPYEAAAEFQALQIQLETVFGVTARLSSLSLNNFLR